MTVVRMIPPAALALGLLLGLPAGSALGAGATATDLQRAAVYTQQGSRALASGDLESARSAFSKALGLAESFPDAHLGLGHVAMKQGRYEEALREYSLARDGFRDLGETLHDLRDQRYKTAQQEIAALRIALRNFQSSGSSQSGDSTAGPRQVFEYEDEIHKLEAIEPPETGTTGEPPGEVHFYIGNAQFRLGRLDDALASWETCAGKSPAFAYVRVNLAVLYWKRGRFEDARQSLSRAEELGFPVDPQMKADLERAARR